MVSYAQHGEDVVLRRLFRDKSDGFYVDIGANDPVHDSVTKYFSLRGWRGINVEPVPSVHQRLTADRPRDTNLCLAVSSQAGSLEIHEPADNTLLATASPILADEYRKQGKALRVARVPAVTLESLLEQHVPSGVDIDFLKVDVEGHEESVIESAMWQRFRPRVVVLEAYVNGRRVEFPTMRGHGYVEVLFDGLNRFFLREESAEDGHFFRHPANTFDHYVEWQFVEAIQNGMPADLRRDAEEWRMLGGFVQGVARSLAKAKRGNPRLVNVLKALRG